MPTNLSPKSTANAKVLPSTGTPGDVSDTLAYGIYNTDAFFSGAADQISYVHGKLGGNILDIELEVANVYKAYEESCLEYSYLLNHTYMTLLASECLTIIYLCLLIIIIKILQGGTGVVVINVFAWVRSQVCRHSPPHGY